MREKQPPGKRGKQGNNGRAGSSTQGARGSQEGGGESHRTKEELRIPSNWQEGPCDGRGKDGSASVGWC